MSLFVFFILAAVLLGAGAMLSPAWRSAQPRIALAAVLCLGLVLGGAVFYAETIGWDTLVVDYILFALLSAVVLGGTLSTAQARAEARGERLADRDQGWPGPADLAFFAFVALLLLIALFQIAAPQGEAGQISGFHSLAARDGGSFNSLAPYHPSETVLIAPGLHALSAYLSAQLDQSIPLIQLSVAAVAMLLSVWLAYDFGAELQDKRLGRALAAATLLCFGLARSYLDGHVAELLALLFLAAFLLYALRLLRQFNLADLVAAGLMMGAVAYTSLSLSIATLLAWVTLLVLVWARARREVSAASRWALTIGPPLVALLGIAPWLVNNLPLMWPISPSPFSADPGNLALIIGEQGIFICLLALWGIWTGLRADGILRFVSLLMLIWLLLIIELSSFGVIGRLLPPLGALTNAPNLARHGVALPFSWFGGVALLQIWDDRLSAGLKLRLRASAYPLIVLAATLLLLLSLNFQPLLELLGFPPATISRDDAAALTWLRENTAADAVVMAADGDAWLPVFAERRASDFRAVRYFEWDLIEGAGLGRAEVDYVFVPAGMPPPEDMPLELVFEQNGARVYKYIER
ncbi:MAG: hypothetical protein OXI34_05560 [Chloroflexota bacterium]|nr:hypothetical protein [Chloroflexota bacterium]MDE2946498.1 hypothetical protein [Chloroflexota bacterium]